jgi:hypothetical protein
MAKYQITVEDSETGVSISVDSQPGGTNAALVVGAMVERAQVLGRIELPAGLASDAFDIETLMAYREKLRTNPTVH